MLGRSVTVRRSVGSTSRRHQPLWECLWKSCHFVQIGTCTRGARRTPPQVRRCSPDAGACCKSIQRNMFTDGTGARYLVVVTSPGGGSGETQGT